MARAALKNEELTRARVAFMEQVIGRGLWGRLKWLFLGR